MASRWSKRLPVSEIQLSDIIMGLWTAAEGFSQVEDRGLYSWYPKRCTKHVLNERHLTMTNVLV